MGALHYSRIQRAAFHSCHLINRIDNNTRPRFEKMICMQCLILVNFAKFHSIQCRKDKTRNQANVLETTKIRGHISGCTISLQNTAKLRKHRSLNQDRATGYLSDQSQKAGKIIPQDGKKTKVWPITQKNQVDWPQNERKSITTPSTERYPMERKRNEKVELSRIWKLKETMVGN